MQSLELWFVSLEARLRPICGVAGSLRGDDNLNDRLP